MPKRVTQWGRQYVGKWVAEDRTMGVAMDPRAEAYANGSRSPLEPLRAVPDTWRAAHIFGFSVAAEACGVGAPAKLALVASTAVTGVTDIAEGQTELVTSWYRQWALVKHDAIGLSQFLCVNAGIGFYAGYIPLQFLLPEHGYRSDNTAIFAGAVFWMLLWLCFATMLWTATAGPAIKLPPGATTRLSIPHPSRAKRTCYRLVATYYEIKAAHYWLKARIYRRSADNLAVAAGLAYPIRPFWLEPIATASKLALCLAAALAYGFVAVPVMADPRFNADQVGR